MMSELDTVVGGYSQYIPPELEQHVNERFRNRFRPPTLRKPPHEHVVRAPFSKCQYMSLLAFPHYQVHLPVPEPASICLRGTLMDTDPCLPGHLLVPPVFHPMPAVPLELPALFLTL